MNAPAIYVPAGLSIRGGQLRRTSEGAPCVRPTNRSPDMLSLPRIVERTATPYVALRKDVVLPFDDEVPAILAQLSAYLAQRGLEAAGPVFFKHNVIDMPYLQMEFGAPLAHPVAAGGEFTSGVLPAGRPTPRSPTQARTTT